MNVLIVHAHPEKQSFSSALCQRAIDFFKQEGHQVTVSDLYEMKFNPVASAKDFSDRRDTEYLVYALEQRKGFENGSIASDIKDEVEKVLQADLIVFNFPIFWFSIPAILKGWIDRVFVSGIFYGGKRIYARGGMRGKQALVCATLGGRQDMLSDGGIHGDLTAILKPFLQGSLGYVGMEVFKPFYAFHVPYLNDEQRADILVDWQETLGGLANRPKLEMPELSLFSDNFVRLDK